MKLESSRQIFEKKLQYQISSKSVQWEPSCSMRTDKQTDMTKLIVAFRNFAKAPKKSAVIYFLPHRTICGETLKAIRAAPTTTSLVVCHCCSISLVYVQFMAQFPSKESLCSERMILVNRVACLEEKCTDVFVRKSEVKRLPVRSRRTFEVVLKWILTKLIERMWSIFICLRLEASDYCLKNIYFQFPGNSGIP
jgi:hypothetical protein